MSSLNTIQTPCIGVCSTGIGDTVCRGCKRFAHEIIDWNRYTQKQRQAVMTRLQNLLDQVVNTKIEVTNRRQLLKQLKYQQIDHENNQSSPTLVYTLLRVGASQINDTDQFGFRVKPGYPHESLTAIKRQIDDDFYTLSCAHYERFIEPVHLIKRNKP